MGSFLFITYKKKVVNPVRVLALLDKLALYNASGIRSWPMISLQAQWFPVLHKGLQWLKFSTLVIHHLSALWILGYCWRWQRRWVMLSFWGPSSTPRRTLFVTARLQMSCKYRNDQHYDGYSCSFSNNIYSGGQMGTCCLTIVDGLMME